MISDNTKRKRCKVRVQEREKRRPCRSAARAAGYCAQHFRGKLGHQGDTSAQSWGPLEGHNLCRFCRVAWAEDNEYEVCASRGS